jgi:predicted aspartyl protease
MGTFNWAMQITSLDGEQTRDIEATVDTGATYTVLPSSLLREIGIPVTRQARFELGDGRIVQMDIGQAQATINGETAITQVVFGEDDIPPGGCYVGGTLARRRPSQSKTYPNQRYLVLE